MTLQHGAYWNRYIDENGSWRSARRPPGEDLAALRSGLGREPGTVPAMWRFHQEEVRNDARERDPWPSRRFIAEHHALTLYGVHQQSRDDPAHRPGVGVGQALRALHATSRAEDASKAIDRRFYAAVTATTSGELAYHLRGLVRMLRGLKVPAPLDYDQLVRDLASWEGPERRERVRRKWGLDYHASPKDKDDVPDNQADSAPPAA